MVISRTIRAARYALANWLSPNQFEAIHHEKQNLEVECDTCRTVRPIQEMGAYLDSATRHGDSAYTAAHRYYYCDQTCLEKRTQYL